VERKTPHGVPFIFMNGSTRSSNMPAIRRSRRFAAVQRREDGTRRNEATRVYIKPSAAVPKARDLAKLELKRVSFDR
jgi:hypothetical protein